MGEEEEVFHADFLEGARVHLELPLIFGEDAGALDVREKCAPVVREAAHDGFVLGAADAL